MKRTCRPGSLTLGLLLCSFLASAQQPLASPAAANTRVPAMVRFNGIAVDSEGKSLSGAVDMTFSIYKEEQGGAALWMETQLVNLDASGHYNVLLGAATPGGLPLETFASGEARWIGIRVQAEAESPRVVLLSVPYALKAADAETIGGLPPTAFALAASSSGGNQHAGSGHGQASVPATAGTVTSVGLAAPATDYSVSGSPVTTAGTLTFAWKVAPTNLNTANAIVKRDATGSFSAGTVTATAVKGGTLSGNGAAVTNVNAASLGGFAPGSYANLAAADTFAQPLSVKAAAAKTPLLTVAGTGTGAGSLTVDGFGDLSLSPGASATPQNLVTGLGTVTNLSSWSNWSAINLIPGFALFPIPTTRTVFYIGFTAGTTATISNMVLYQTARGSYKITAVTPVKLKGVSNPTITLTNTATCPAQPPSASNPCIVRLDPLAATLSPVNDYYLVIFFPTASNNSALGAAVSSCTGCASGFSGSYISGDASRLTVGQSLPTGVVRVGSVFLMGVMTN